MHACHPFPCCPGYMRSIRSPPPIVHRLTMGAHVHRHRRAQADRFRFPHAAVYPYRPRTLQSSWQATWPAGATPEKSKEHTNLRILTCPKKWQDAVWILRYAGGALRLFDVLGSNTFPYPLPLSMAEHFWEPVPLCPLTRPSARRAIPGRSKVFFCVYCLMGRQVRKGSK